MTYNFTLYTLTISSGLTVLSILCMLSSFIVVSEKCTTNFNLYNVKNGTATASCSLTDNRCQDKILKYMLIPSVCVLGVVLGVAGTIFAFHAFNRKLNSRQINIRKSKERRRSSENNTSSKSSSEDSAYKIYSNSN